MSLQGKVVLITGAASGIGFLTAIELLRNDIEGLVLTDINEKLGQKSLQLLHDEFSPDKVIFKKVDTTKDDEFEEAFKAAISTFGNVDIVINNAGLINESNYCRTVDVNLVGAIRGTNLGLKYMSKENGKSGGTILNLSSVTALSTAFCPPIYSATKFGVLGMSLNYGKKSFYDLTGVRVVALCPGSTTTSFLTEYCPENKAMDKIWTEALNFHPRQKPESVARAAVYAITNGESGSTWIINGGKLFKANIPDWSTYSELVNDNI